MAHFREMLPAQPNRSVLDGMHILHALTTHPQGVGVSELSRDSGLETTRVHRLLRTFAHLGYAYQDADRRYRPGPAVHLLAVQSLHASGLLQASGGPLHSLQPKFAVVALGVLWRDKVCYLLHAAAKQDLFSSLGRTRAFPAEQSAIGLSLLAQEDPDEVEERFAGRENLATIQERIAQTRRAGFAWVSAFPGEHSLGVCVCDGAHAVAAIAGVVPDHDKPPPGSISALHNAAAEISEGLSTLIHPSSFTLTEQHP